MARFVTLRVSRSTPLHGPNDARSKAGRLLGRMKRFLAGAISPQARAAVSRKCENLSALTKSVQNIESGPEVAQTTFLDPKLGSIKWIKKSDKKHLIIKVLLKMVAEAGIEPATQGFSVLCSTN